MTATIPGRPVLRYHGGKWRLAPWVIAHLPAHRVYVEPFAGAASVLMQKRRSDVEVINDLDGEVVNLFRVLRDPEHAAILEKLLRLTPFAREEFYAAYEVSVEPIERARRLVARSFMGWGSGGCNPHRRVSFRNDAAKGGARPARDWHNYPEYLAGMSKRLQGVCIESRPAIEVIREIDEADCCFYVDPPYVMEARQDAAPLYAHEMTGAEHRTLAELLHGVKGMVVLSGYRSDLYNELFRDWPSVEGFAYANGNAPRTEVLWFNPQAAKSLQQRLPFGEEE